MNPLDEKGYDQDRFPRQEEEEEEVIVETGDEAEDSVSSSGSSPRSSSPDLNDISRPSSHEVGTNLE